MAARLTVAIDGEQVPYDQTEWVIHDPKGYPVSFISVERSDLSNGSARGYVGSRTAVPERALKRFCQWATNRDPLTLALEGYTVTLVHRRDIGHYLDQHLGKIPVGQERLPEDKE
jgi:hypothetical protein